MSSGAGVETMCVVRGWCEVYCGLRVRVRGHVDEDLGVSGKRVKARFLRCVRAGSQVLAAYCAPRGQSWHCPGLAPARQCKQLARLS